MKHTLLLVTLLACTPAFAQPDEQVVQAVQRQTQGLSAADIRQYHDACDSGVTLQMNICHSYRLARQDLKLNATYARVRQQAAKTGNEAALLKAQRAWLAWRDSQCAYEGKAGAGGGSAEGLFVLSCREALTGEQETRLQDSLTP
ncbi:DUF1311 domain-containing protein [Xylophilus rhododendri]|uniref:DUF1311 domain-containing protein n=1 Tax=Xylophilus rhododendri TaxID=2697032 RepID=A0A857J0V0_9BURK|nr:lysozyme inhibitor LprI family protein [Xylophilus rhododendri]QHI96721.1 DUF1311 domain-containing protein [Xylophilus rhododendri]